MSKLSKKHFWVWFTRHQQDFLLLNAKTKKERGYWLNELNAHLRAYYKFLGYAIEWQSPSSATLTITVFGQAKYFRRVEELVAAAPGIKHWIVRALDNARPIDFLLEPTIESTGIDPAEMQYSLGSERGWGIELKVYHPMVTDENAADVHDLARSAVYNLLGEQTFGTYIHDITVHNLSTAADASLENLETLPEALGSRNSGISVDSDGNLFLG